MNLNVDALLIVSAMIFVVTMGGLGASWLLWRRDERAFREDWARRHADRG